MAVLVGLMIGALAGLRRWRVPGWRLLVLPLGVAGLEIVTNLVRFGASEVALWSVVLVVLTVVATLGTRAATVRWAESRAH